VYSRKEKIATYLFCLICTGAVVIMAMVYISDSNKHKEETIKFKMRVLSQSELIQLQSNEMEMLEETNSFLAAISPLRLLVSPDEIMTLLNSIPCGNPLTTKLEVTAHFGVSIGAHGVRRENHKGIDIIPEHPEDLEWGITPIADGVVEGFGEDLYLGKWILIKHSERVYSFYAHLSKIYYSGVTGQEVNSKTRIGEMGDTGLLCDGAHLHFELRVFTGEGIISIDPYLYIKEFEA